MRPKLSVLTLFRSPLKTLITFLLLAATSFAFVSRGAEYAATVAEIERVESTYTAIGTLERTTDGYTEYMENLLGEEVYSLEGGAYVDRLSNAIAPLDAETVQLVLSSPYIASSEFRHVAGGLTSEELTNVTEQPLTDVPNYSEWDWYLKEGTFEMDTALVEVVYQSGQYVIPTKVGDSIEKVVIGDDPYAYRVGQRFHFYDDRYTSYIGDGPNTAITSGGRVHGNRYLLLVTMRFDGPESGFAIWKQLVPVVDYPVLNLTAIEEEYGVTDYWEVLKDPAKYGVTRYQNLSGLEQIPVLDYIETLYRNFHTQELVHVSGMETLHKYHAGDLYISDGRAITANDTGLVCVVSTEYAAKNGLAVGDSIEFELSADTMMHSGKVFGREPPYPAITYAFDELGKRYYTDQRYKAYRMELAPLASEQALTERGLDTVTQTYEIVGLWSDSNFDLENPYTYSVNTIFVPASTYPWHGEVEPTMLPSTFSFTLNHPGDMAKIESELGDKLAALGYELAINDMGYAAAKPSLDFMKLSALIGFAAMSLALLLSLVLITYLFIIRKKRDYAIMRALGTPRRRANGSLLVGLFTLAFTAVFLGSAAALIVTQNFAADLSAQLAEITGSATASTMPAWLVGAFGAGVLALLLIFARVGLVRISRTPPLMLLQGGR